jgi:hypothetical protein
VPGEIAEAFVLIRPNTTGFKQETEASARTAALGAAKIFAGAFAGIKLFDFAKSAVGDAAQVQKSTEAITEAFGGASKSVLDFSHTTAAQLGISTKDSQEFSDAIGIQAKNLGLSQEKASEMAVGLQKLAGSIGQIRGLDPVSTFGKLELALLGNTRGLKSLGISANTAQIAQAALDAGIVKSTVNQAEVTKKTLEYRAAVENARQAVEKYGQGSKEAVKAQNDQALAQQAVQKAVAGTIPKLTDAQRAEAIYAIATKHLGEFQGEAAKHSSDLTNEQHKLSAEWENAKTQIGAALLPAVTSLTGELLHLLAAVEKDKAGFETAFHDIGLALTPVIFGVKELAHESQITVPVIGALAAAFASYKVTLFALREGQIVYNAALAAYRISAALATGQTDLLTNAKVREAIASGDATGAEIARATAAQAAATAVEAENIATSQATIALGLYQAAAEGTITPLTANTLAAEALEAANVNLALSEESATAATVGLDAALASNPFGLLALGVSAVVGGLIAYKSFAGSSASESQKLAGTINDLKGSFHELSGAVNNAHDDLLNLFQAELSTKQSERELEQANHKLADAIRNKAGADKIYKDQLAVVNALEKDGQKGTPAYAAATAQLAVDKHKAAAASRAEADAQLAAGGAYANNRRNLDELHGALSKVQGDSQKLTTQADGLATTLRNKLKAAFDETTPAVALFRAGSISSVTALQANQARLKQFEDGMLGVAAAAKESADQIGQKADADQKLADQLKKINPVLGQQVQELVDQERAAQQSAKQTEAMDLATQQLTEQLGKVPTAHQVNVYYKQNLAGLTQQAKDLGNAIADIASNKTINVQLFLQAHGAPAQHAAGGFSPTGELSVTGEKGPELSITGQAGRQIISHQESVDLLANLAKAVNRLVDVLTPAEQKPQRTRTGPLVENLTITEAGDAKATAQKVLDSLALAVPR